MRVLVVLGLLLACCFAETSSEVIGCYFAPNNGLEIEDIDPFVCTHMMYSFAGLNNETWTIKILNPSRDNCPEDDPPGNDCGYQRFVALKEQNPELKTLLSVGGWGEGSEYYSDMVGDPAKRATFIQSTLELLGKEGFDGMDLDWEYPTQRGGVPEDKANFITLLEEFRVEFDSRGLLLTAAVAAGITTIDESYDAPGMARTLDLVNVMTYAYHGAWEGVARHNSLLCRHPADDDEDNVVGTIYHWLSLGIPKSKLIIGIPLYGKCFTLLDYDNHGYLAPITAPEPEVAYNVLCERLKNTSDCTSELDPLMHEPYMYCKSDNLWCGYDDPDSVTVKARFAKNTGLAGAMVWAIDLDDLTASCGPRTFDLIKSIKDAFVEPGDPSVEPCTQTAPNALPAPRTFFSYIKLLIDYFS